MRAETDSDFQMQINATHSKNDINSSALFDGLIPEVMTPPVVEDAPLALTVPAWQVTSPAIEVGEVPPAPIVAPTAVT